MQNDTFLPLVMVEACVMELEGTVKRFVAQASLQATTQSQIFTAPDMFKWALENIPGVKFCVSAEDVVQNSAKINLPSWFAFAKTLSGTCSHL